jgi:hypothetical protein
VILHRQNSSRALRRAALALTALALVLGAAFAVRSRSGNRAVAVAAPTPKPAHPLTSAVPAPAEPEPLPSPAALAAPTEDIELVALLDADGKRQAMFALTAPEKTAVRFTLQEGEHNEWLEILSIDPEGRTVNAILKRIIVRNRNAGAEVLFSFKARPPAGSPGAQ